MNAHGLPAAALLLVGCQTVQGSEPLAPDGTMPDCDGATYPASYVEPMALGEAIAPYAWPEAIHRGTGARTDLELATVPCASDDDIDWSPFDVLLFVSIPAW